MRRSARRLLALAALAALPLSTTAGALAGACVERADAPVAVAAHHAGHGAHGMHHPAPRPEQPPRDERPEAPACPLAMVSAGCAGVAAAAAASEGWSPEAGGRAAFGAPDAARDLLLAHNHFHPPRA